MVSTGGMAGSIRPGDARFVTDEMIGDNGPIDTQAIDAFANENGVAISLVDATAREVSVFNNNSICRRLNPDGVFSPACAQFCGRALDKAADTMAAYECHAGLECRAIPVSKQLVAIVGRTFVKAENYRRATERSIAGDWKHYAPAELFENILLTASEEALDDIAGTVARQTGHAEMPSNIKADEPKIAIAPVETVKEPESRPTASTSAQPADDAQQTRSADRRAAQASAWRSFFGSLLEKDHAAALNSILEFLAHQYGLSELVWLERRAGRFEQAASFGVRSDKRLKLGIAPDDHRLIDAARSEMPIELGERRKGSDGERTLSLFPIGIGGAVSAAVATLNTIADQKQKRQIARICLSLAPQIEILRLRNEVAERESLSTAVRSVSESLQHVDADDFWLSLTRNAAEMLRAERASLMVFDERAGELVIKAIIGAKNRIDENEGGHRVARIVFDRGAAAVIADVPTSGLEPVPERGYRTDSFLSCPISLAERTIGVMNFTDRADEKGFDAAALALFSGVAPQIAVAVDRATLKDKAGEFEQLSVTDPLTGLLNRRYIEARLAEEIKRSNRHGFPMSLMLLDVDHFKSYNDQFGHPAGDEALKLVGSVIRETLRGADVAARFGGEEFSILLPQTTGEEALAIAERIRHNIEHTDFPFRPVTASIGVASCSAELCVSADLVSAADQALYEAKSLGRNRVRVFEKLARSGAR